MDMEALFQNAQRIFVSDYDGTMTDHDFYIKAATLLPEGTPDFWQQHLDGEKTVFEVLQDLFASIRGTEDELMQVARSGELDPGFSTSLKQLEAKGWRVVVASIGCEWYISRILAEQGANIPIVANPGKFVPGQGLQMTQLVDTPFHSTTAGVHKEDIVKAALATGATVAFAGDSRPDYDAAMTVEPQWRFARHGLADILESESIPYHCYDNWSHVARMLLEQS